MKNDYNDLDDAIEEVFGPETDTKFDSSYKFSIRDLASTLDQSGNLLDLSGVKSKPAKNIELTKTK